MHTVLCSLGLQLSHGITVKVSGDLVVILKIHEENLLNMTCYFLPQVSVIVVMVIVSKAGTGVVYKVLLLGFGYCKLQVLE